MTIELRCVTCSYPLAAHQLGNCPNGGLASEGFILMGSHTLDDMPPARRALERARLAQARHDRRMDVQLPLSSDGAF